MNTKTIYIQLLDEGTKVYRPITALSLGGDIYKIPPSDDYNPELEKWEFPPGSIVRCIEEIKDDRKILVAQILV